MDLQDFKKSVLKLFRCGKAANYEGINVRAFSATTKKIKGMLETIHETGPGKSAMDMAKGWTVETGKADAVDHANMTVTMNSKTLSKEPEKATLALATSLYKIGNDKTGHEAEASALAFEFSVAYDLKSAGKAEFWDKPYAKVKPNRKLEDWEPYETKEHTSKGLLAIIYAGARSEKPNDPSYATDLTKKAYVGTPEWSAVKQKLALAGKAGR